MISVVTMPIIMSILLIAFIPILLVGWLTGRHFKKKKPDSFNKRDYWNGILLVGVVLPLGIELVLVFLVSSVVYSSFGWIVVLLGAIIAIGLAVSNWKKRHDFSVGIIMAIATIISLFVILFVLIAIFLVIAFSSMPAGD
jgi:hypothetical protein